MSFFFTSLFCIVITLASYFVSLQLYHKYKKSWLNPLFTASCILILFLFFFHVPEETYTQSSTIFSLLLQVSVVSLAVPLYKQWTFLKNNFEKILIGVMAGTVLGLVVVLTMSHLFNLKEQLLASLIPRSVTLPVALTISDSLGGISSITIIYVIISALIAVCIGPKLLRQFGIKSKSAKGLAMGTSAQMIGVNRSLIWGEEEGAMGNIAMTTSALFLSLVVPILLVIL